MASRETLSEFISNLHKFSPLVVNAVLKDWQNFTEKSFTDSQRKVPLLTGHLQNSGAFRKARITANGIESSIVYTMPYAKVIESGERNGKKINLRPLGRYWIAKGAYATKQRVGETGFLGSSVDANEPNALSDIFKSIEKAWDKI